MVILPLLDSQGGFLKEGTVNVGLCFRNHPNPRGSLDISHGNRMGASLCSPCSRTLVAKSQPLGKYCCGGCFALTGITFDCSTGRNFGSFVSNVFQRGECANFSGCLTRDYCTKCNGVARGCLLYTSDAADEEDSVDLGG